jgi:hypothetical protein
MAISPIVMIDRVTPEEITSNDLTKAWNEEAVEVDLAADHVIADLSDLDRKCFVYELVVSSKCSKCFGLHSLPY